MMKFMSTRLTKESTTGGDKEKKDVGEGKPQYRIRKSYKYYPFFAKGTSSPLSRPMESTPEKHLLPREPQKLYRR